MPPIPIYTSSPINAAKASGVTPQTAAQQAGAPDAKQTAPSAPTTTSQGYPAPKPGAAPSMPLPTGSLSQTYAPIQPTPTQDIGRRSPPAPQPGAVPVAPSKTALPPPPKAGETYQPPEPTAAPAYPAASHTALPPQLSMPSPATPYNQRGTSSSMPGGSMIPTPQPLGGQSYGSEGVHHPPGYQQNVNASEFSSQQRAAHEALISTPERRGSALDNGDEGVWSSAMKWAQVAGEKLSAAESEVWKRINKE